MKPSLLARFRSFSRNSAKRTSIRSGQSLMDMKGPSASSPTWTECSRLTGGGSQSIDVGGAWLRDYLRVWLNAAASKKDSNARLYSTHLPSQKRRAERFKRCGCRSEGYERDSVHKLLRLIVLDIIRKRHKFLQSLIVSCTLTYDLLSWRGSEFFVRLPNQTQGTNSITHDES